MFLKAASHQTLPLSISFKVKQGCHRGDSVVHIYPWFKFHLPLFFGKLIHWNNLHVKREGLHHILGSLKKDVFE